MLGYTVKVHEKARIYRGFDEKSIFIIDSDSSENLNEYAEIHDNLLKIARSDRLWSVYYEFRKNNLLMIDIERYSDGGLRAKSDIIKKIWTMVLRLQSIKRRDQHIKRYLCF